MSLVLEYILQLHMLRQVEEGLLILCGQCHLWLRKGSLQVGTYCLTPAKQFIVRQEKV